MKKYESYIKNLDVLKLSDRQDLANEFIISGIIDKFMLQFKLGWKMLKALLKYEGDSIGATGSPREIIKEAWKIYDFMDEEVWLDMLAERNNSSHVYDGTAAKALVSRILATYIPEFETLRRGVTDRYGEAFCLANI